MRRLFLLLGIVSLFFTSCSSFHRQWRQAVNQPPPSDLTGAWEGGWTSTPSGHRGKLRCIVTPKETMPGFYDFHYWARWGLLSGAFATTYPVRQAGPGRWTFEGDSDLGALGGVYRHQGEATAETFQAAYTSDRGDRGRMEMTRPQPR